MSKTLPITKLSIFFVLCSIYLFSFAHFGAFAYDRFMTPNGSFAEGTSIGHVDVSSLSDQQAAEKLSREIENWKGNQSIILSYMDAGISVDSDLFHVDLAESIDGATQGESSPLVVSIQGLNSFLSSKKVNTNMIDMDALGKEIALQGVNLNPGEKILYIENFYNQSGSVESISEVFTKSITPGIQDLIDAYPEIELAGASPFSFLKFLESENFTGLSNQELSTIASCLYQLILPTNFEVIERHQGRELPEDVELGFEAYVNQEQGDDFIFANPNDAPYQITLNRQGDSLSMTLIGEELPYEITVKSRNEESFKPRVIKQYSPYLNKGEMKIAEEGRNGLRIELWRRFETKRGDLLKEEKLSEDFYLPVYREEIHSTKDYAVQQLDPAVDMSNNDSDSQQEEPNQSSEDMDHSGSSNGGDPDENGSPDSTDDDRHSSETDLPLANMK